MSKGLSITTQSPILSPLVLESVRVIALEMTEVDKTSKLTRLSNTLNITHEVDTEATTCTVVMDVCVKHGSPDSGLYAVHAKVEGVYGFQPGVPDELKKLLVPLHPAVNLLGFLRGMVFQATSILPCGSIPLPLFDLTGMIVPEQSEVRPTTNVVAAAQKPVSKPNPRAGRSQGKK